MVNSDIVPVRALIVLFMLFMCCVAKAQKCIAIFGVCDEMNYQTITDVDIRLLRNDSVEVEFHNVSVTNDYALEFDYVKGLYTLILDKEGYATKVSTFEVSNRRNTSFGLGTFWLQKMPEHKLNEVTVSVTRIKMVMKGDTIVYDANAFQLAQGSMLDALISQLPGAELEDGQIKVNGKFIESLLLNGEEFFNGNASIALQNLPAYTVKDIKVYDRSQNDAYLKSTAAQQLDGEEHLVMDVNLKKVYQKGWMGNVDLGYGSPHNKYLGKGFLMGFRGKSRLTAFVNVNNIKDTQSGTSSGGWNGGWAQDGDMRLQMAGLDLLHVDGKMKYMGTLTLTHERPYTEQKISSVNFYDDGNTYTRQLSTSTEKKKHLMFNGQIQYSGDRVYLEVRPKVDIMNNSYSRLSRWANFNSQPTENYRMQSLDSLFANWQNSGYYQSLLSMHNRLEQGRQRWTISSMDAKTTISFPKLCDDLELTASGSYHNYHTDANLTYTSLYGAQSTQNGQGDQTQQKQKKHSNSYTVNAGATYNMMIMPYQPKSCWFGLFVPYLKVSRNYQNHRYNIDDAQITDTTGSALLTPSMNNSLTLERDLDNSYHSQYGHNTYTPGFDVAVAYAKLNHWQYQFDFGLKDQMHQERLEYDKDVLDTTITRFSHNISPSVGLEYRLLNNPKVDMEVNLNYTYSQSLTSIYNLVGQTNTSDPNNIYVDNPDLKRPQVHNLTFNFQRFNKTSHINLAINAAYSRTNQAVAQGRYYDRTTGVSTWQSMNINGNWNASAQVYYQMPLGKKERWQLSTNTQWSYVHSADYSSDDEQPQRSIVRNTTLGETVALTYKVGKHQFGYKGFVQWQHSTGSLSSFENINAVNFSNALTALVNLKYDWQIGTDIHLYCRRGYVDKVLNTTEWVWNAQISKSILKGKLTFKLEAQDILDQISNVQHSVNAQGRTETWTYNLHQYVMLHVMWRFNVMPKQKS